MELVYANDGCPVGFYVGHLPNDRVMVGRSQYRAGKYWEAWGTFDKDEVTVLSPHVPLNSYLDGQEILKNWGKDFTLQFEEVLKNRLRVTDYNRYCKYYGKE